VERFISTSGSTHWYRTSSTAWVKFVEDRVLHAREDAEENARAERLADPDAYTTEPRDSNVSDEDLLTLNPRLRRSARDDVVLETLAFSGPLSRRLGQVVSLSTARDIPRS
jgi:hypothetical protein